MAESDDELKSLLMKVKEESENEHSEKITASGPITSWQIDGETVETVTEFILFFFFWLQKSLQMVTSALELKNACSSEEKL